MLMMLPLDLFIQSIISYYGTIWLLLLSAHFLFYLMFEIE